MLLLLLGLFLLWYHWFWGISSYLPDLNLTLDLYAYELAMYRFGPRDILEKLSPFRSEKNFKMVLNIIKCVILIQTNQFLLLQPITYSKSISINLFLYSVSKSVINCLILFPLSIRYRHTVFRNTLGCLEKRPKYQSILMKFKAMYLFLSSCAHWSSGPLSAFIHVTIKLKKVEKH